MSADSPSDRELPLGRAVSYPAGYDPALLVGLPRATGRAALGIGEPRPFDGVDVWNAYELSWLDPRGKPVVATGELRVPASSLRLVESKSLKLYLNSLNSERFEAADAVVERVVGDLTPMLGVAPTLALRVLGVPAAAAVGGGVEGGAAPIGRPEGDCIDGAEIDVDTYAVDPALLEGAANAAVIVDETLHSQLLRSQCPVTGQPDWATLQIHYRGPRIDRAALLRYVVSYREHDEFHEHCVERMFVDLKRHCAPEALTVFARYTRRGGLDINPFRSDFETLGGFVRLGRQ